MNQNNKRTWITCGLIGLVVVCIGTVVAVGGFAAVTALLGLSTSTDQSGASVQQPTSTSQPASTSGSVSSSSPTTDPGTVKAIPYESVVQITAMYYDDNNRLVQGWTGSGSIITADGLILTNAHVVLPDRYFNVDALAVSFTTAEDQPPQMRYYAEVVQADEPLDIAVIKITTDLNGNPVNPSSLDLPFVPLGDADQLHIGDSITILGYPGIGGDTITLTRGEVSGFTSEANRGPRAFIKTSGTIAGGNSGGLAADSTGYLIGIPTQLGYGGEGQFVDCRVLADTNRDGVVDDRDNCVPTGGFINALRPINLALPLIEAAKQGQVAINQAEPEPIPTSSAEIPAAGEIIFQDDFSTVKGDWAWEGTEGSVRYEGEALRINVTAAEYLVWGLAGENFGDVIIEADTNVTTSAGDGDFGIICRYQDETNYYALEISEDGYFIIWKYVNSEYFALVDWTYSSAINTNAPNHLSAACVGNSYILRLNGTTLAEVTDTGDASGDAGLVAGTWDVPDFAVNFDNFVVKSPQN